MADQTGGTLVEFDDLQFRILRLKRMINRDALSEAVAESLPHMMVELPTKIILEANRLAEELFGGPLAGVCLNQLIPSRFHSRHDAHAADYQASPHLRLMGTRSMTLTAQTLSNEEFDVEILLNPIDSDENDPVRYVAVIILPARKFGGDDVS